MLCPYASFGSRGSRRLPYSLYPQAARSTRPTRTIWDCDTSPGYPSTCHNCRMVGRSSRVILTPGRWKAHPSGVNPSFHQLPAEVLVRYTNLCLYFHTPLTPVLYLWDLAGWQPTDDVFHCSTPSTPAHLR